MPRGVRKALIIGTAAVLPATGAGIVLSATSATAASTTFPAHYSAPYLQIDSSDASDMDQTGDVSTTGVQFDQWTCKSGTGTNQDFATR